MISGAKLKHIYSAMMQCRIVDERAGRPRSRKRAHSWGTEAIIVGAAIDLRRQDWLVLAPSGPLAGLVKGMPLRSVLSQLDRGASRPKPAATGRPAPLPVGHAPLHILPPAATPEAQLNLAAGVALTLQSARSRGIVMAFISAPLFGPRWHEALHFAGAHCLPLVVVVQIGAPAKAGPEQTEITPPDVASQPHACGFPIIPVDADDAVAIYRVAHESIHKARYGGGPTLIEARIFRRPGARPRTKGRGLPSSDPIARMEDYLIAKRLFSAARKRTLIDKFNQEVDFAIKAATHAPPRRKS